MISFITEDGSYDRNHGAIPHLDASTHRINVDGDVRCLLSLCINDLATKFPQHEVTCVLQCAGNRRHTMRTLLKEVDGIDWGDAAVMNCRWKGPRLRDVLLLAGVELNHRGERSWKHVAFACYQTETQEDGWYGSSIDLERAMSDDEEVILALEVGRSSTSHFGENLINADQRNGKALTPNNGAPVRVVVPGVAGARSVKWLDRITIQSTESSNFYQQHDYKILPEKVSNKHEAQDYWDKIPALQEMPVNSIIATPESETTVTLDNDGMIEVTGYALPQGSQGPVLKVEVSGDEQKNWIEAEFVGERTKFSWAIWHARVKMEKGSGKRVYSRAIDAGGNKQEANPVWNLRGVAYNGYGEARDITIT